MHSSAAQLKSQILIHPRPNCRAFSILLSRQHRALKLGKLIAYCMFHKHGHKFRHIDIIIKTRGKFGTPLNKASYALFETSSKATKKCQTLQAFHWNFGPFHYLPLNKIFNFHLILQYSLGKFRACKLATSEFISKKSPGACRVEKDKWWNNTRALIKASVHFFVRPGNTSTSFLSQILQYILTLAPGSNLLFQKI